LPFRDLEAWKQQLKQCYDMVGTPEYERMRHACVEHGKNYTLEKMANAQWEFFKEQLSPYSE